MSDTPINVLFQQAAALKTAQLAVDRTKFDSWDSWYQHALFSKQDVIDARKGNVADNKIGFARECKNQGSNHFREQRYDAAILEYERCLSMFDWIEPTDPDWRKKGIQDKLLVQKSYRGEDAVDATEAGRQIEELRLTCILNLSMCFWKTSDWAQCIRACDRALELDPSNTKALYRRAQARILPAHCGTSDNLIALEDLKRAVSIKPDDAMLTTAYAELKIALAEQKKKDRKTFSNLFDRANGDGTGRDGSSPAPSSVSSASSEANLIEEEMVPAPRLKGVPKLAPSAALHKSSGKAKAAKKTGTVASASPSSSSSSNQVPEITGSPSSSSAAKSVAKETVEGEKKALTWQDAFDMVRDMQSAAERCEREGFHQQAATIRAKKEELQKQMKIHFPKHVQNSITPELLEQEAALSAAQTAAASDSKSKKKKGGAGSSASKLTTAAGGESPANWFDVIGPDCELVDFTNPTAGMIADARNKGLDLTDPRVQQLMQEINRVRMRHVKEEALLPAGAKGRPVDDANHNAQRMDRYMQEAMRNIHTEEAGRITTTLLTDVAVKTQRKMLSTRLHFYEDELHAWEQQQRGTGTHDSSEEVQSEGVTLAEPNSFFGCCAVDPWTCEAESLHATLRSMMVVDIVALRTQLEQEAQQERARKAAKGGAAETAVGLRKRTGKLVAGAEQVQETEGGNEEALTDEQRALKVSEQIVDMLEMKYGTAQHSNGDTAAFLPDVARMVAVVGGVACVVLICINVVVRLLQATRQDAPFDPAEQFK